MARVTPPELDHLRDAIDQVDRKILDLLAERVRLVLAVGDLKRERGMPVFDPDREDRVLADLAARAGAPLEPGMVRRVFERIIEESRGLEAKHVAK